MSIKASFPDIKPSLMLDFANTKRLDPRITFTRATTATYYDGKTVAKAEENLHQYSQSTTGKDDFHFTATNNAATAPDGTTTATLLTAESSGTAGPRYYGTDNTGEERAFTSGVTYTVSAYFKAGTATYCYIALRTTTSNIASSEFNLSTGSASTASAIGTWSNASSTMTDVGNGWYRCTLTATAGATTSVGFNFFGVSDGTGISAAGYPNITLSGQTVYIWGLQKEKRSSATAYTPTTTQPITNYIPVLQSAASGEARFDHDPVTGESKGLLIEEQRTNLVLNSTNPADASYFSTGTSNAIRSSNICFFDPASNMVELQGISGESSSGIWGRNATFSTASRTVSLIVKNINNARYVRVRNRSFDGRTCVSYDLETQTVIGSSDINTTSITNIGNGFYRIVFSTTAAGTIAGIYVSLVNSSNAVFTMTGSERLFVASPQIELGAFPTSYIPTVASQVTRNADAATMTGTNFSSWYRADEGSFYAEAMPANIAQNPYIFTAESDISNLIQSIASSTFHFRSFVGGVTQADIDAGTFSDNTYGKVAGVYKVNDFAVSLNSGTVGTDTDGLIPFPTTLYIGADSSAVRCITIKKLAYYPARLSNTELQGLTS
jgi:hypothetical protein